MISEFIKELADAKKELGVAGQEDSNPQQADLESAALPLELLTYSRTSRITVAGKEVKL